MRPSPLARRLLTALTLTAASLLSAPAQNLNFPGATPSPAVQMGSSPSFAVFNGKLYAAFQANDPSHILFITSSTDGVSFPAATGHPAIAMGSAPALAVFNNRLYVAFQANDPSHLLFLASSADGVNFSQATGFPGISIGSAPALAAFNNQLFVAFEANDSGHALWTGASTDGVNFSTTPYYNMQTNASPALAAFNGSLYIAFRANDSRNVLFVTASPSGANFPQATEYDNIAMGTAPAIAASGNALYIAFQASDAGHALYVTASTSGAAFPAATGQSANTIGGAPTAAGFNIALSIGFQANDSRNILYTTSNAQTGGGGGGGLPKHVLLGYWQDYTNGATPLTIAQVPTTYNIIAVAFGVSTGTPGQVAFSVDSGLSSALGGYSQSQFIADIRTAHTRGQKVVLSVGGQNGNVSVTNAASASQFASSVSALMNQYGFDGVDIDLESGISPQPLASAITQLKQLQPNALVTAAPQTVDVQNSSNDYFQWASLIGSNLTMMNTQYYNSGTMLGCDGQVYAESTENFATALACTQLQSLAPPASASASPPPPAPPAADTSIPPSSSPPSSASPTARTAAPSIPPPPGPPSAASWATPSTGTPQTATTSPTPSPPRSTHCPSCLRAC